MKSIANTCRYLLAGLTAFFCLINSNYAQQNESFVRYNLSCTFKETDEIYRNKLLAVQDSSTLAFLVYDDYSKEQLIAIRNGLTLLPNDQVIEIPVRDFKTIKYRSKDAPFVGFLAGLGLGFVAGFALARSVHGDLTEEEGALEKQFKLGLSVGAGVVVASTLLFSLKQSISLKNKDYLSKKDQRRLRKIAILR